MKLRIFFLLTVMPLLSFGQMKQSTFVYGPKIGLNFNRLAIIDNPTTTVSKIKMDFNAGIFTRYNAGKFSIQPEVMYQTKGGRFTNPSQLQKYKYISVPVLFGYRPLKGINFELGPEYSWAINAGSANTTTGIYGPDNKKDVALVIGTRIDMLDLASMFSLDIRYMHGLQNVTNRVTDKNVPLDFRNRTLQVSLTYNFSEYYKWWRKYGDHKKKKK